VNENVRKKKHNRGENSGLRSQNSKAYLCEHRAKYEKAFTMDFLKKTSANFWHPFS
jgi:hypothetical protein